MSSKGTAGMGKTTVAYMAIRKHRDLLLKGTVIAIDPSCGSSSSMPGYAVYRAGDLVTSGTIQLDPTGELWARLRTLAIQLTELYTLYTPDVLIFEQISPRRYGGGSAHGHASLLKSVGVVLSIPGPEGVVPLAPRVWKSLTRSAYRKSDEGDAVEMGWITIQQAREMPEKKVRASKGARGK